MSILEIVTNGNSDFLNVFCPLSPLYFMYSVEVILYQPVCGNLYAWSYDL